MIQKMAKENKEEVRNMFTRLFDEQTDVYERIKEFKSKSFKLTSSIDKKLIIIKAKMQYLFICG